eukprot:TRINITY_DN38474_c0_g1_i1.p1 TRINITY_DN38474_c0_g1~~TRINITY_DN38474_c0_g1_i1.p1  ORF type:complete len:115 (+),score=20.49 TRINITY_DN38474_c0_g1_i1:93-437(+)
MGASNINIEGDVRRSRSKHESRLRGSNARSGSKVKPGSSVVKSDFRDLQKSSISVNQVKDEKVTNLFQNAKTEKVVLTKTTHEHAMYVREHDYLTRNEDGYKIDNITDTTLANY